MPFLVSAFSVVLVVAWSALEGDFVVEVVKVATVEVADGFSVLVAGF